MKPSEIVLLTGVSAFAGILLFSSMDMPFSSGMTFGPGFLPLIIAGALLLTIVARVLSGLVLCATAGAGGRAEANHDGGGAVNAENGGEPRGASRFHAGLGVVALMGVMAVVIASMDYVGVLLPLALLMVLVSWYFAGHSLIRSIGVTLLVMLAIYVVFAIWLRIPLY